MFQNKGKKAYILRKVKMKKVKARGGSRITVISFSVVILIFVLINGLSICLLKMEDTMSPDKYSLLLVEKEKGHSYGITILNQKNILSFDRFYDVGTQNQLINAFIPPVVRCFINGLKIGIDTVESRVCESISSQ